MERAGSVTLVGAGCGKGLITVKGLLILQQADVVVYDDLIDQNLLSEISADCERIYVGKRLGKHSRSQEEINGLLVQKAREGKQVVRLKGGDGFVFGRGGEEILFLQKSQIPYDVIPGVTSAIAVPGHGGIPVTHRGIAQSVTIVTGHSASEMEENYQALAGLKGTLVFLMGLSRIEEITRKLLANGKAGDTPAAIISKGYCADEKRIDGVLSDIAGKAGQAKAPAILVVGQVAGFDLSGSLRGILDGVSVTVTGTESFVRKMRYKLSAFGAEVDSRPCLRIVPDFGNIPDSFAGFDWAVFTSANGVDVFFKWLSQQKVDVRRLSQLKFACLGPGTAAKLEEHGIYADFQPTSYTAKKLGEELAPKVAAGEKVLVLRARDGSPELVEALVRGGVSFEEAAIYHTAPMAERISDSCAETDYIVFGSAHGVEVFLENATFLESTTPVCIGPVAAGALKKMRGMDCCLVPESYTVDGIAEAIIRNCHSSYGQKTEEMR